MPWEPEQAVRYNKSLNAAQRKKWAKIANGVLKTCMAENGKDCEGRAIRIANNMFKKRTKRLI